MTNQTLRSLVERQMQLEIQGKFQESSVIINHILEANMMNEAITIFNEIKGGK